MPVDAGPNPNLSAMNGRVLDDLVAIYTVLQTQACGATVSRRDWRQNQQWVRENRQFLYVVNDFHNNTTAT